jgi:Helix-turn-helix domain
MADREEGRRRGRWYPIDNVIIDRFAREVGSHGIAVYNVLVRFADREGTCWPSVGTIAEILGLCRRSVTRALQALEHAGLIAIEPRYASRGGRTSNMYRLLRVQAPAARLPVSSRPVRRREARQIAAGDSPPHRVSREGPAPPADPPAQNSHGGHDKYAHPPVQNSHAGCDKCSHEQDLTNKSSAIQQQPAGGRNESIRKAFASFNRRFYLVTGGLPQLIIEELAGQLYDRGVAEWWEMALDAAETAGARHLNYVKAVVERALRDGYPPDTRARERRNALAVVREGYGRGAKDGFGLASLSPGPRARDPTPEELEELRRMGLDWLGPPNVDGS